MSEAHPESDPADDASARYEHDLRNALSSIKGHSQLLRRHLRKGPPHDVPRAVGYTEAIEAAAERIVRMVETWRGRVR